ncbi:MAG: protein-disulfide reductase DsbD domain-containing protein, partial [Alphaproteobacteria bacterium]
MTFFKHFFIFCAFLCIGIASSTAALIPPAPVGRVFVETIPERHAQVELLSKTDGLDGHPKIVLGVRFKLQNGAHIYWRTPGDSGQAPQFDWSGSTNIANAKVQWPSPKRFFLQGLTNFGYEKEVVIPIEITLEDPGEPLSARLFVDYIVCQGSCYPEQVNLSIDLYQGRASLSKFGPLVERFQRRVPARPGGKCVMGG